MLFILIIASVQDSLEKKFGRMGGKIDITPSEEFLKRMAVSFWKYLYLKLDFNDAQLL